MTIIVCDREKTMYELLGIPKCLRLNGTNLYQGGKFVELTLLGRGLSEHLTNDSIEMNDLNYKNIEIRGSFYSLMERALDLDEAIGIVMDEESRLHLLLDPSRPSPIAFSTNKSDQKSSQEVHEKKYFLVILLSQILVEYTRLLILVPHIR
ncbi:unnamed protein product [Spirodela intermedia]|uniref:Uncharacterized protein n=1 Tax=Spirodela intermedia TaxID=51605 RepID=A0A7I8LK92_SPIIN|nr:unnamed protein product [Spirodela intermedia]